MFTNLEIIRSYYLEKWCKNIEKIKAKKEKKKAE
jgi:hypothetical protein